MLISSSAILKIMRWLYAALSCAVWIRLVHIRLYRTFPLFLGYLFLASTAAIACAWGFPHNLSHHWWQWHWLTWQPFLAVGMLASIAELWQWAMFKAYDTERAAVFWFLLWFAVMAGFLIGRSFPDDQTNVQIAAESMRYLYTGFSMFLLFGCGWHWIRRRRLYPNITGHAVVLTAWSIWHSAALLLPTRTGVAWNSLDTVSYVGNAACLALWAILLRVDRSA